MRTRSHISLRALASIGQHDHACFVAVRGLQHAVEIGMEPTSDNQHGGAKLVQSHEHLLLGLRLRHNAHFVFDRQHFGDSRAEDCLVIGQNQFEHRVSS